MKTILVPTDFSPTADKALILAKDIARKTKSGIHLANFYVIPLADYSQPGISIPGEILDEIRKASKEGIKELSDKLREEGIEVDATVEIGMATDEIVELAKKINADLIVMGTTGGGSILNKLIGSNASNVMQNTTVPIILVPKDYKYNGIYQMVYADSLKEDDNFVIQKLFDFAESIGALDVMILNINTTGHYEPLGLDLELRLHTTFGSQKVKLNFVDANTVKEGLDIYLKDHNIDLVVMSTHKKTLLERIFSNNNTRMLALYSKVPLMVYHK